MISMRKNVQNRIASILIAVLLLITEAGGSFFACVRGAAAEEGEEEKPIPTIEAILKGGPAVSAKAGIVMEVRSGAILFAKNATESLPPISLTKLMTALLVLEEANMTDTVKCSYASINGIGSKVTRVGLVADERLAVEDMLYACLVASADEATYALGEHTGGSMRKFLKMMNARMEQLGGVNTTFNSATGTGGTTQTSCAYDIALIASRLGMRNDFLQIAGVKWYQIPQTNLKESRTIAQTHKFIRQTLKYDFAIAGKSGGAAPDGTYNLCTYAERDGMRLVAIVMGSASDEASYDDSVTMLNYAFENYKCYTMRALERTIDPDYAGFFSECQMFTGKEHDTLSIDPAATVVVPHGADLTKISKKVEYIVPEDYVHGENVIGRLEFFYEDAAIGTTDIIFYNEEYPLSQKDFNAMWPKFLLSPSLLESVGGPGTATVVKLTGTKKATPTPTPLPKSVIRWEGTSKQAAATRAGVIFGAIFIGLIVLVYIVVPMIVMRRAPKSKVRRR